MCNHDLAAMLIQFYREALAVGSALWLVTLGVLYARGGKVDPAPETPAEPHYGRRDGVWTKLP